uniref:Uncharacterized protein n=1 Tax=Arundo donax TaxID=35708 RepID=A0A0A8ZY50_ARUDO
MVVLEWAGLLDISVTYLLKGKSVCCICQDVFQQGLQDTHSISEDSFA